MNSVFSANKSSAHLLISFPLYFSNNNEKTSTQVLKRNSYTPNFTSAWKIYGEWHISTGCTKILAIKNIKHFKTAFCSLHNYYKHSLVLRIWTRRQKSVLSTFCHYGLNSTGKLYSWGGGGGREWGIHEIINRKPQKHQNGKFQKEWNVWSTNKVHVNASGDPRCPRYI